LDLKLHLNLQEKRKELEKKKEKQKNLIDQVDLIETLADYLIRIQILTRKEEKDILIVKVYLLKVVNEGLNLTVS
jgi:hypothetical protein